MLALERWAEGRFRPFAMTAQVIAANVNASHEMIEFARSRSFLSHPEAEAINNDTWLRLYRQPLRIEAVVLSCVLDPAGIGSVDGNIADWSIVRRCFQEGMASKLADASAGKLTKRDIRRGELYLGFYYRRTHLPILRSMLNDCDKPSEGYRCWLGRPEIIFALAVAMPCWLEYQETPWELFWRVRRGDWEALEKLLRIDPLLEQEPRIRKRIFHLMQRNPAQYHLLKEAAYRGRTEQLSLEKLKFLLAGLLMWISEEWDRWRKGEALNKALLSHYGPSVNPSIRKWVKERRRLAERFATGCRLTTTDVKQLFDAAARDRGIEEGDTDFLGKPNTIYRRIERNSAAWRSLREADILRAA